MCLYLHIIIYHPQRWDDWAYYRFDSNHLAGAGETIWDSGWEGIGVGREGKERKGKEKRDISGEHEARSPKPGAQEGRKGEGEGDAGVCLRPVRQGLQGYVRLLL